MKKEEVIDFINKEFKDGENIPDKFFEDYIMEEVVPHPYIDEGSCKVYKANGDFLCNCTSGLMFLDILCQIARNRLDGYFAVKNDIVYKISNNGQVDTLGKPQLFSMYDKYMEFLLDFRN